MIIPSITYSAKFMCESCKKIFDMLTNVSPDPNFQVWVRGFLCYDCAHQSRLSDLGFEV